MLEIVITSSALILVLCLLRLFLRDRISAQLQYALWLLVALRLLVPVSLFHSPVSVAQAAAPAIRRVESYSARTPVYTPSDLNAPAPAADDPAPETAPARHTWTVGDAARCVWYAGMAGTAAWFLLVNVRLARRLKRTRTAYAYPSVLPVYIAPGLPSPCLFGLFRPAVYLTEHAAEDEEQARQIITHELTHHIHGDLLWSLLRSVCLVVWWFNPLVWLAAALSRQDCELACDEGTINALGETARFDYGRTLVGMAAVGRGKASDLLCGATTMTGSGKSLKQRVARIAHARKMPVAVAVTVLIIAAVVAGCAFTGAAETDAADTADGTVSGEDVMPYDREYWAEVERELGGFAAPADIEVIFDSPYQDENDTVFAEDPSADQLTLADYIYSSDSWRFAYNGGLCANLPLVTIKVTDAAGRKLWIMDDMDELMIEEADGSVTWVYADEESYLADFSPVPAAPAKNVDLLPPDDSEFFCADMIRHLRSWALGELVTPEMKEEARQAQIQLAFDELGSYSLPGQEAPYIDAYEMQYVDGSEYQDLPFWVGERRDVFGWYIRLAFGTALTENIGVDIDLAYERFWSDAEHTAISNAVEFENAKSYFRQRAEYTVTDALTVNGYDAFTYSAGGEPGGLMWYDTDAELIFRLSKYEYTLGLPTAQSAPTAELIALAETVE